MGFFQDCLFSSVDLLNGLKWSQWVYFFVKVLSLLWVLHYLNIFCDVNISRLSEISSANGIASVIVYF